jgi:hypothetical protein
LQASDVYRILIVNMVVKIIVDSNFGERLNEVAALGPVWIADTSVNRRAAENWWRSHPDRTSTDHLTTFKVNLTDSPDKWVVDILSTVELHSGAYDDKPPTYEAIEVWGATLSVTLREFLKHVGYSTLTSSIDGFRAGNDAVSA